MCNLLYFDSVKITLLQKQMIYTNILTTTTTIFICIVALVRKQVEYNLQRQKGNGIECN